MDYSYKKPKVVPGKADIEAQKLFIRFYEELKFQKKKKNPIYFMDGAHPQHNTVAPYGWIKKRIHKGIKSNSGRQRMNINEAINIENLKTSARYGEV